MKSVRVSTQELLECLKKNREKHRVEYQEAIEGYLEEFRFLLETECKKARDFVTESELKLANAVQNKDLNGIREFPLISQQAFIDLEQPRSHTDAYDRAIAMLEWEQAEFIDVSESDFRQYVLDQWDWQQEFQKLSRTYIKKQ